MARVYYHTADCPCAGCRADRAAPVELLPESTGHARLALQAVVVALALIGASDIVGVLL